MTLRTLSFLFLLSCFSAHLKGAELAITGIYQGKNIYVQNPFVQDSKDFCVQDVFLNNTKILSGVESSAFEIDLSSLKLNDNVSIRITHKEGCFPKILNPHVIKSNVAFSFTTIHVSEDHVNWGTKGENPNGHFYLEHYVYGEWLHSEEIHGKGSGVMNSYNHHTFHHSGTNKYRMKFVESDGVVFYSQVVEYQSDLAPLEFYPKRITDKVFLSRESDFEILDNYGNSKLKGRDKIIDMVSLPSGIYYLNADNKTSKIYKK